MDAIVAVIDPVHRGLADAGRHQQSQAFAAQSPFDRAPPILVPLVNLNQFRQIRQRGLIN